MNKQDKEKAEQISKKYARQYHHNTYPEWTNNSEYVFSNEECYHSAMEMAKWKDEQINEEKKDLLELVKMLNVDETNQTIIEDLKALLQ